MQTLWLKFKPVSVSHSIGSAPEPARLPGLGLELAMVSYSQAVKLPSNICCLFIFKIHSSEKHAQNCHFYVFANII